MVVPVLNKMGSLGKIRETGGSSVQNVGESGFAVTFMFTFMGTVSKTGTNRRTGYAALKWIGTVVF